jgi:integrase
MAHLGKVHRTRYVVGTGKDRRYVSKGTAGAKRINEESEKWYAIFVEGTQKTRVPLAKDKTAAQAMFADLIRQRERQDAGLISPFVQHTSRSAKDHVADYMDALKSAGVTEKHHREKDRQLHAVLAGCDSKTLAGLTTDKVNRFLTGLTCSARTKNTYRSAILSFGKWLEDNERVERNPFLKVMKPNGNAVRKRRALTAEQIQRVLDVARKRPLVEGSTIRRGKRKGEQAARLRPEIRERLIKLGRERAMIYLTAIYTGLRRGEIAALRVGHLHLDAEPYPYLELPGDFTKNRDLAKLLLVPALADELRTWISEVRKLAGDRPFTVPNEIVKTLKADLKAANIPYKDEQGRVADFHSLRMTADTMLGLAKVPPKVRQLFMRHSDIRLTLQTYDDSSLYELQDAVKAMEALRLK